MDIGVTLDERIADGFYFIRSMQVLQEYLANPERLLERPEIPPPGPTQKEMRRRKRLARKEAKRRS
jgi:hypothetical protein